MDKNFIEACRCVLKSGRVLLDEPMSLHTTFKIGGPADCLIFPATMEETQQILKLVKDYHCRLLCWAMDRISWFGIRESVESW